MEAIAKFDKLFKELELLKAKAPAAHRECLIELAQLSARLGKTSGIIPKVTGNLRSTSRVEINNKEILFITGGIMGNPSAGREPKNVNYAYYVNNGSTRQRPQFFMERSVMAASVRKDAIFRQILNSWLKNS